MSDFRFGCPHCGQRIEGDAAYRGTQINCPACQKVLTVPAPVAKTPIADLLKAAAANPPRATKLSSLALISFVCSSRAMPPTGERRLTVQPARR